MAATAAALGRTGMIGGALFVVSDGLIGVGAAGGAFAGRGFVVMATYVVAQGLLTLAYLKAAEKRTGDDADTFAADQRPVAWSVVR
jgi:hypothetical protein